MKENKVILNNGNYKDGDVLKSIESTTDLGYGTKDFPKEDLLTTTFYFKISHELELCVDKTKPLYCKVSFTHEKPLKGKRGIIKYEKTKIASQVGIKTVKEMNRLIKNISKKQYDREM